MKTALDIKCSQCGAEPGTTCPFPIAGGYAGVYDYAHPSRVDEIHRVNFPPPPLLTASTITTADIRRLLADALNERNITLVDYCDAALGLMHASRVRGGREYCAAEINRRAGVAPAPLYGVTP